MVSPDKWNCKARGECYLTYRRRLKREQEEYEANRAIKQSNEDWIDEYNLMVGSVIHRKPGETIDAFLKRCRIHKKGILGETK